MDTLAKLLALSEAEKEKLGVVHTPREVSQQPSTWRQSYRKVVNLESAIDRFLKHAGLNEVGCSALNVFLLGAGTSDYIGKSVSALLQKEWQCDVQAIPSTDLLTNLGEHLVPGRSYLWISFSRSGDSSEGVALLQVALERYPKIKHVVVTCNQDGQMASAFQDHENVFKIVLDDAVNDRGLAMTSSFSNMVVVGQALAHFRNLKMYSSVLEQLVAAASFTLPKASVVCERLVRDGFSKVCFLGSGALKGAAVESALKVLELTNGRKMSFAESFLGLRHGPLSAIDPDTLVVAFLSGDERRRAFELDLLSEISDKQLTSKCLSIFPGATGNDSDREHFLGFQTPISDLYRPPVDVLFGQFLGLFASLREGLKPDAPSPNGTINRVVSSVKIH